MNTKVSHLSAIAALFAGAVACGPVASAEPTEIAKPFASGVQINVVVAKPARAYNGYSDEKKQKITLTAKFTNIDTRQAYEGYTAVISALGQSASDTKVRKVLMQERVTLSLPPLKAQQQVCPEVITSFDKVGYKYGIAYYGWIIVVKDPDGKVVQVKASTSALEKYTELAAKLENGKYYDAKLKPVAGMGSRGTTH